MPPLAHDGEQGCPPLSRSISDLATVSRLETFRFALTDLRQKGPVQAWIVDDMDSLGASRHR